MIDVVMPDGTKITNVPDDITKQELLQKYNSLNRGPSMSAIPEGQVVPSGWEQAAQMAEDERVPSFRSLAGPTPEFRQAAREGLPLAGAVVGASLAPGLTWPQIIRSAIYAGGGGTAGSVAEQALSGDIDLGQAGREGLDLGEGTLFGGTVLKGLGAAGSRLFDLGKKTLESSRAAKYAGERGLPFPASSTTGSLATRGAEQGAKLLLPGELATRSGGRKAAQFINNEIARLAPNAKPTEVVVQRGQRFLSDVLSNAREAGSEAFQSFTRTVGKDAKVVLSNTGPAVDDAVNVLKRTGQGGALMQRLRSIQKAGLTERTLGELEIIRKELGKVGAKSNAVKEVTDKLRTAIINDYDELGKSIGVDLPDMLKSATSQWRAFEQLRKIPGMKRFSKEIGDFGAPGSSRKWLIEFFNENNKEALNILKQKAPDVYAELSTTNLSNIFNAHIKETEGMIGRILDGPRLRAYFEANRKSLEAAYGRPVAQVLDNFTRYAKFITPTVKQADRMINSPELLLRGGSEAAAMTFNPWLIVPEASSYPLAQALMNPNSSLFKLFTQGISPTSQKAIGLSLKAGGGVLLDEQ